MTRYAHARLDSLADMMRPSAWKTLPAMVRPGGCRSRKRVTCADLDLDYGTITARRQKTGKHSTHTMDRDELWDLRK